MIPSPIWEEIIDNILLQDDKVRVLMQQFYSLFRVVWFTPMTLKETHHDMVLWHAKNQKRLGRQPIFASSRHMKSTEYNLQNKGVPLKQGAQDAKQGQKSVKS